MMAERRAQEILWTIQPSVVSDRGRQGIIGFLQGLIKDKFQVKVFPFGSVPLKTYLPDGDIDLTVVSKPGVEKDLAMDICNALIEQGEKNPQFPVRHVNYVQAKVDQLIGRGHLFKRSIILVKAWCYYESRILGAQSGLLSTYAIEVLVLNIINHFHATLVGPLSVLYKFLDYYGKFDWDRYCVSLDGPVPISSLPNISVEPLHNNLLLGRDFLDYCKMLYSIPVQAVEVNSDTFLLKYLNIIDPLKVNNNLGRSVTRGSAKRIRFALVAGAKKLRLVLDTGVGMGVGVEEFFDTALERNGKGQRMDAKVPVNVFGTGKSDISNLSGDFNLHYQSLLSGQLFHGYTMPQTVQRVPRPPLAARFQETDPWNIARQLLSYNVHSNVPQGPPTIFVPAPLFVYPVVPQQTLTFVRSQNLPTLSRSRGIGTYIPQVGHYASGHRQTPRVRRDDGRTNSCSIVPSPVQTRVTIDTAAVSRVRNDSGASSSNQGPHAPVTTCKRLPAIAETPQTSQAAQLPLEAVQTNLENLEFGGGSEA